jgi:hypothetical protein
VSNDLKRASNIACHSSSMMSEFKPCCL